MRSRYDLMKNSSQKDSSGNSYPDVLTLDLSEKVFSSRTRKIRCSQLQKDRPWYLTYRYYGYSELDDLLLWMNGVSRPSILEVGETLYIPSREDFESYYTSRLVDIEE